ncbi:hypothetical protein DPMN_040076 [Dreissena polymorpha]|uniref:Uncharacterized protein n=1 Tax=Dreissena polymorpha TaxID=45954 RepID=A0A9D4HUV6_DREPO|nr:hypothetical protein DPMN_040076 [Dreissena polymorpha]
MSNSTNTETYVAIPLSDNSHSATVAEETLVHRHSEMVLVAPPGKLPKIPNLLVQPKTNINHPNVEKRKFDSIDAVDKQYRKIGFSKKTLEPFSQLHGERVHTRTIPVNSECTIAGVVRGKLVPILPL